MVYNISLTLILVVASLTLTEGCGRAPATPKPTEPTTTTAASLPHSVNSYPCSGAESNETACLNNGTCFVYIIEGHRSANCRCTAEYTGERCTELVPPDIWIPSVENRVATAGIAASLAVLIVIIIVFTAIAVVYIRRRKKEKRDRKQREIFKQQQNGMLHTNGRDSYHENGDYCNGHKENGDIEEKTPLSDNKFYEAVYPDDKFMQTSV